MAGRAAHLHCTCKHAPDRCRGEWHRCVCRSAAESCRAKEHLCVCPVRSTAESCRAKAHKCVCLLWGPGLCRRGGPAGGHKCVCDLGRWRTCRLWGAHGDERVEARAIRALVVANYGAAETAPGADDVLRGFAALPYQLKLAVLETPWMAPAD